MCAAYMLLSTSGWWRIGYAVYIHCMIWWCSTTEIFGMIPSDFPTPLTPGRGSTVRRWPRWPMEAPWVLVVYPKEIAAIWIGKWMIHRLLYSGSLFSDKPMWVWVQTLIVWHLHFSASYNTTAEPAWAFWMYLWSLDFCIWWQVYAQILIFWERVICLCSMLQKLLIRNLILQ